MPAAGRSTPSGSDAGHAATCSGKTAAAALERPAIVFFALQRAPTLVEHRGIGATEPWTAGLNAEQPVCSMFCV